ncbi:hypothetical protein [Chitinophaga tropicalis]|uniref:HMA domain-containing protein n=1 Tax=Chitinophaga tropicalis TaxID=2683588 RepID=A0A7K1UDZ9_9BACT|nr:hypothetical protein [Chitinophaga tropicalis]MVT12500.1 hypothetical protein [Chitinophaga tropicalis]
MYLIFKTNIQTRKEADTVITLLKDHLNTICTVDVEDCDKVLRAQGNTKENIVKFLNSKGYECEELQ